RRQLDDAAGQLAGMTAAARSLQGQLDETTRQAAVTQKKLQGVEEQARTTAAQLDKTQGERDTARGQLADLTKAMLALEARKKDLTDAKAERTRMGQVEERALALMREVAGLQGDRKTLQAEVERLKGTVDNRFAGIALTGRRVLFLVDMSGSMDLVDEKTQAP